MKGLGELGIHGYSPASIVAWWDSTTEVFSKQVPTSDALLCGVDGNLRITHPVDAVTGNLLDREPNPVDRANIVDLCACRELIVANTCDDLVLRGSELGTGHLPPPSVGVVRFDYI